MDFNAEDRIDKEMDMDMDMDMDIEYDMIPMPMYMQGGVPGMMPLQMTPTAPGFTPPMMQQGPEMIPGMMLNPNMMEIEDDYEDIDEDMTRKKNHCKDANKILMKIEKYNPGIFRYLRMYGVPYPVAKKIIRKIIKVTLMYYDD